MVFARVLVRSLIGYVPGSGLLLKSHTGGSDSIRYCYAVWLRHLSKLSQCGVRKPPRSVAELGPGDSLGLGLAALLSGAEIYYGLDVYRFAKPELIVDMFDQLVELFRRKEPIPDEDEFPTLAPNLESYEFPEFLWSTSLDNPLDPTRIARLRSSLQNFDSPSCAVRYIAPWVDTSSIIAESVDILLSQAVLELVPNVAEVYKNIYLWLKPGGLMSHQIDFGDPRTTISWNGNWAHSDFLWNCLRGRRAYWGNRQAHSVHIDLMRKTGFAIMCDVKQKDYSGLRKEQLAPRFQGLSNDDITTRGAFIVAKKPAN